MTAGPDDAFFTSKEMTALRSAATAINIFGLQAVYSNRSKNLSVSIVPLSSGFLPQCIIIPGCGDKYWALMAVQSAVCKV
ncbi:MAG: hypothetical protein WB392_14385 [Methanotrichaceae archaeon]